MRNAVIAVATALLLSSCASPPLLELQEARAAIAGARDFEADIYAPDQYDLAVMNLDLAEEEIDNQEEVAAIGRSYDQALAFLAIAVDEAERAQLLAEDIKAQIFLEAQNKMPVAQTALDDAFDMLARARGVLAFREAQTLEARLSEMAASLNLAQQLMDDGGFADAVNRLDIIIETAREVETRTRFVMETAPR